MVRIGVTGHMNITEATTPPVYQAIRELLTSPGGTTDLVGVSCIARGSDSVFARAVLDIGGQLEVVLPSRNYRERKVKPDHAELFDEFIGRASTVRVMDFDDAGREAYEGANETMLSSCDRLIAVWDGAAGQQGGTGTVVELAANGTCQLMSCGPTERLGNRRAGLTACRDIAERGRPRRAVPFPGLE